MESVLVADWPQPEVETRDRGFLCGSCYDAVFERWAASLVTGSQPGGIDGALLCPACFQAVLREWLAGESIEQVALKYR